MKKSKVKSQKSKGKKEEKDECKELSLKLLTL